MLWKYQAWERCCGGGGGEATSDKCSRIAAAQQRRGSCRANGILRCHPPCSRLECWLIRYVVSIVWGYLLNLPTLSLHGLVFKICVSKEPNLRRDLHWRSGCSGWADIVCTANSVEGRPPITFLIDGLMRMAHLTLTDVCWIHIQHIYDYNMPSISISIRCLDEPAVCILHSDACAFSRIGVQVF